MSRSKKAVSIIPLTHFECELDIVKLEDGLCIRRIGNDERKKLAKLGAPGYDHTLEMVLNDVEYVIEKKWREEQPKVDAECARFTYNIVLALRLLKDGHITTPTSFLIHESGHSISEPRPRVSLAVDQYLLQRREISTFKELWRRLQNIGESKPHLKFPLAQFSEAFERFAPKDVLIDYMVAFESIVFRRAGKSARPVGIAIGIAIGMFLGNNEKERSVIEKDIRDAYMLRNAIVHGDPDKKFEKYGKEQAIDLIFRTQDYLRQTLKKLIEE